tara:strand:- start:4533 stop:11273 length:6741 start_codon:yes stop_codon:yes gene_type:complete
MSTVFDYLEEIKRNNPQYRHEDNASLYQKLRDQDASMPSWSTIDNMSENSSNMNKRYESKHHPSFMNNLFDWTDWGIDEGSSRWAKLAYNQSITGLAYRLYNGEDKYQIDDYNTAIWEDVLSAVASFAMPLDILTMRVGRGVGGVGLSGLARISSKKSMLNALKKGAAKQTSRISHSVPLASTIANKEARVGLVEAYGKKLVDGREYAKLFNITNPIKGAAVQSAGTLATFEGVKGGVQAAADGTDIWEGIGHGVMHGGIMGGVVGMVGGSLNVVHSKLFNKIQDKPNALSTAEKVAYYSTGKVGQVMAEATVFTAPEVVNMIKDDEYTGRDLLRSYATNIGMMGLMKIQHSLMAEGKKELDKYMQREGESNANSAKRTNKQIEELNKKIEELPEGEAKEQAKKDVEDFRRRQFENRQEDIRDFENWEKSYDKALEIIKDVNEGRVTLTRENADLILRVYEQIQKVHGAMVKNINYGDKTYTKERQAEIDITKERLDRWEKEIIEPLNDIMKLQKKMEPLTEKQRKDKIRDIEMDFAAAWDNAVRNKNKAGLKELRKGLEDVINEKGEIIDSSKFIEIQENINRYNRSYRKDPTKRTGETVVDRFLRKHDAGELTRDIKEESADASRIKNVKLRNQKEKLLNQEKEILSENYGEGEVSSAYNVSKKVLAYISRKIIGPGGKSRQTTEVNHLRKLAKFLADRKKSLLEVTDRDMVDFIKENPAVTQATYVKLIKGFETLAKGLDIKPSELMKNWKELTTLMQSESPIAGAKELLRSVKEEQGGEGVKVGNKETGFWDVSKQDSVEIPTKTGSKIKHFTKKLGDFMRNLTKKVLGIEDPIPGHENYLFRNRDGSALTVADVNIITKQFFKLRKGYHSAGRQFRNAIEKWAKKKYENNAELIDIVDNIIVGHGTRAKMIDTYGSKYQSEKVIRREVQKVLKEFIKDIKNNSIKTSEKTEGYSIRELHEGFKKLQKQIEKGDLTYKDSNGKTKTLSPGTLETMFEYMRQTGPRLNEIAPTKEVLKLEEKYANKEQQKTEYQLESDMKLSEVIATTEQLKSQIAWAKKKFPKLSIALEKTLGKFKGDYVLGKIQGHLIKIAKNRARIDTIPHEVAHHVVDVLKAMGDPFSKRIVKEGIKKFGSEEALVESIGKYVSKQLPKSMMGRMRAWISRAVSRFKQYFGITNIDNVTQMQKEIVEIIGGKVLSGKIPTDYLSVSKQNKIRYQTSNTKEGRKIIAKIKTDITNLKKDMKDFGYTDKNFKELEQSFFENGVNYNNAKVRDLESYQRTLQAVYDSRVGGASKTKSRNEGLVDAIEKQYDVSLAARDAFFKDMWNIKFENAPLSAINVYKSHVAQGKEVTALNNLVTNHLAEIKTNVSTSIASRVFNTAADVLRKMGKPGELIADKLMQHDFVRSVIYKGPGERTIELIKTIVDKKTSKKYMHFVDKELATQAIKQLEKMVVDYPNVRKYKKELSEMREVNENFHGKNGVWKKAVELWRDQAKDYWNSLTLEIAGNTRSSREAKEILDKLNKKYIQDYFIRRVSREVIEHINESSPEIKRLRDREVKRLSESSLKEIAEKKMEGEGLFELGNAKNYKALMKANESFKKKVENVIGEELMQMFEWGPAKVQPNFLKERSITLPEYMQVEINGKKQLVKTYETSIEGTMQSYVNGMSKFLATVRLFPEYTDFAGQFSVKAKAKRALLEKMLNDPNKVDAVFADLTIKRQLGIDYSRKDILMNKTNNFLGKVTNYSALVGLSSPLAGIKNLLIQIPRSMAVYGVRNTFRGMSRALKAFRDPSEMMKAIERGETGYGQKELLFGTDKKIQWWFKNINLMEKTENFNRIMTSEAGRLHFESLIPVLRGEKSMFYPKGRPVEIMRMLKETWKLNKKDIDFLMKEPDLFNSGRYQDILNYVGFSAHKASAGATGVADLPLWMSNKYIKPLTLFQRMATSVTIDSYKNYVVPMKNGNLAPMIKALVAHGISGATLYAIYDKLLDQQVPTEESAPLDKAFSYIWRGEMLGVFGEILSPYSKEGNINPLMEPVLVRNFREGASQLLQAMNYGKNPAEAINDFMKKTIVIYGQGDKLLTSINHPYVTKYKRIKSLENQWREKLGVGYRVPVIDIETRRSVFYWDLKKAIMFGKSPEEIAKKYWAAFDYLCTEKEATVVSRARRENYAKKTLAQVINKMNPLDLSIEADGRIKSVRNEFLSHLSEDNYNLAIKLENEFRYKKRAFENIIKQGRWATKYSIYPS